jgi:hypothetical protein
MRRAMALILAAAGIVNLLVLIDPIVSAGTWRSLGPEVVWLTDGLLCLVAACCLMYWDTIFKEGKDEDHL